MCYWKISCYEILMISTVYYFFSREFLDYASSNNLEIEWSSLLHFCIVFDFSLLQNDVRCMMFLWFKRYRSGLLGLLMFKSGINNHARLFTLSNSKQHCFLYFRTVENA